MFRPPISATVTPAEMYTGLSHKIRALLRETAQPVAVVTSLMPQLDSASPSTPSRSSNFHGATLSSFTSISMSPHHLVAFSLRVPSRMATTLARLPLAPSSPRTHMVINLLAAPQARAATLFSRPDLHPRPFDDPGIQWSLSKDGFPMLHGCLGALSCRVVGAPWPLNDLAALGDNLTLTQAEGAAGAVDVGDVQSELFIAQVMRVEDVPQGEDPVDNTLRTLPLVYHRQGYTTTSERLPQSQKSDS